MTDRICSEDGCTSPAAYYPKLTRCGRCHYQWQKANGKQYGTECIVCGNTYTRHRKPRGKPCCSAQCRQKLSQPLATAARTAQMDEARRNRYGTDLVIYVKPRRTWTPTHTKGRATWRSGPCRVCGKHYTTWNTDLTCSTECHEVRRREVRSIHKARRRARKRDAYRADVHRKRVFELDGYRCHLCSKKTDPTKAVPHPKAPTIDHVIPLTSGGTHEPANCRTAHFICNTVKRDHGGGEQLALLG